MAITTLDGAIAGMKPPQSLLKVGATMEAVAVLHSLFYTSGAPGSAVAPTPGMAGAALTTYAGQIAVPAPVGATNIHLARLSASSSTAGRLILVDRLWHQSGIVVTTTTAQTVNSVTWPARDNNGSTNGVGVMVGIEVSTATTNAGAVTNTTLSYTDESGNAGATATMGSFPATAVAGTFVPFQLAAGDSGARSVQSVTLGTSYGAGTIHLVAYRVLASLAVPVANVGAMQDLVALGMPRVYDDSVPFLLWLPTATTAINLIGEAIFTQG